MVYTPPLTFHADIKGDLQRIQKEDAVAHARILALLRQLQQDAKLIEKLLDHGFGSDRSETFSVNKWLSVWNQGTDMWRLKDWELEDLGLRYRIIYLYLRRETRFIVMAIVKRGELDYDDKDHPIRKRVLNSAKNSFGVGK